MRTIILAVTILAATPVNATEAWQFMGERVDQITGLHSYTATARHRGKFTRAFTLRCKEVEPGDFQLSATISNDRVAASPGTPAEIQYRVDDKPHVTARGVYVGYETVGFNDPIALIDDLLDGNTLRIRVTGGFATREFTLSTFAEATEPVRSACGT